MKTSVLALVGLASIASFVVGCAEDTKVPDFTEKGQTPEVPAEEPLAYAPGPYGISKGSTIPNLKFYGLHDPSEYPQEPASIPALEPIELAEFYNPDGNGTFPIDGEYRPGEAKPTVLWIDVSAQWCGPCQTESKEVLPVDYAKYHDKGLEIIIELIEDTKGNEAIAKNLWQWTTKYKTAWPAVIDPTRQVDSFFVQSAYPTNILIDTKTMKIVYVLAGAAGPGHPFYTTLEKLLKP